MYLLKNATPGVDFINILQAASAPVEIYTDLSDAQRKLYNIKVVCNF